MINNSNSWKGYPYPVISGPKGFFGNSKGIDQIKADLLVLLLTSPGERVMLPSFGTPLKDLIFEPGDASLVSKARQMIVNSITQWEPRISVDQINVSLGIPDSLLNPDDNLTEKNAILTIQIQFKDPGTLTESFELVLDVPLPGG
jgi:phage baseplate assembly protein W